MDRTPGAADPKDLRRALLVSLCVGTALVALNQGDVLLLATRGVEAPHALLWKIPLTYAVPLLVSYFSSVAARREGRQRVLAASPVTLLPRPRR